MAPRETHRLGHRLYLLESVAKIAATQETYHPRFVKRASRKLKCRRISNVGGLQPNRRSLRLRHSGGASLRRSSSIVFGGGWGPQSMSGCRLNGGSQAVNDLFGSGETTQAATSRRLRPVPPRLDPTFRSMAGERGPLSGPHNSRGIRRSDTVLRDASRCALQTADEPRQLIAIRVDPGVLDQFRKEARRRRVGYQTLINEVLARHVRKDVPQA